MWAVELGDDGTLSWRETARPDVRAGEVLVKVAASAVNRADLMQAAGHYPVPPGASQILGLECSGTIEAVGDGVDGWSVGDECCALLAGGGYAEFVAVPAVQLLPLPDGVDLVTAASLPEVTCTVWSNLVMTAHLQRGERLLVHGGGSGIGTMAVQVGVALGAEVAVTASRDSALLRCAELGADLTINYAVDDFEVVMRAATGGADVILDVVGAKYLQRNISTLRESGRLVIIGFLGGTVGELDLSALMQIRGTVACTALRSRPTTGVGSKAEIIAQVREHVWPMIAAGTVRPVIDDVLPMSEAGEAHRRMAHGGHIGKIVLEIPR